MIHAVLLAYTPTNYNGVVVDARAINPGTIQYCSVNWANTVSTSFATTILLPSGTIATATTWILPSYTHVIGEGPGLTVVEACNTNISVCSGAFTGSEMIDMGSTSVCILNDCNDVTVERLSLDGNGVSGLNINGIVNQYSQELSSVRDVGFSDFAGGFGSSTGTGLIIKGVLAQNSGPYSDLTMTNVGTCVALEPGPFPSVSGSFSPPQTRGIHGINCVAASSTTSAGIYVDTCNNTIEDVALSGFPDGILLGSLSTAYNNVLMNISGSAGSHLVHLSNATGQLSCPVPPAAAGYYSSSASNVSDVTILGVSKSGSSTTIQDDLTNTALSDPHVGMYVVGGAFFHSGTTTDYSRFTTSQSLPTWRIGSGSPTGVTCATGSLYSQTTGGSSPPSTIWECEASSNWVPVQ
jgi:hypothetical protein